MRCRRPDIPSSPYDFIRTWHVIPVYGSESMREIYRHRGNMYCPESHVLSNGLNVATVPQRNTNVTMTSQYRHQHGVGHHQLPDVEW